MMSEEYSRFERARIIGARALQISAGAKPLVDVKDESAIKIAEMEFEKDLIPLDVKRKMPAKA
jgi:DNA-directed RNA polymerase subunit K